MRDARAAGRARRDACLKRPAGRGSHGRTTRRGEPSSAGAPLDQTVRRRHAPLLSKIRQSRTKTAASGRCPLTNRAVRRHALRGPVPTRAATNAASHVFRRRCHALSSVMPTRLTFRRCSAVCNCDDIAPACSNSNKIRSSPPNVAQPRENLAGSGRNSSEIDPKLSK